MADKMLTVAEIDALAECMGVGRGEWGGGPNVKGDVVAVFKMARALAVMEERAWCAERDRDCLDNPEWQVGNSAGFGPVRSTLLAAVESAAKKEAGDADLG